MTQAASNLNIASSKNHPNIKTGKIGILLVNLGTPSELSTSAVRKYLREFLSDRRVIELHPFFWKPILYGMILPFRPQKSLHAYQKIWLKNPPESPLRFYTKEQSRLLSEAFSEKENIVVSYAMRYGMPSLQEQLYDLQAKGCLRIAIMPLYPQYAASTTASACDEVFRVLMKMRWQPSLRICAPYYDDPIYIFALKQGLLSHLHGIKWKPEAILASFHGLPKNTLDLGDPYSCQCHKTLRLLNESLPASIPRIMATFQSRFGPKEWLQPYTDKTIKKLAQEGVKNLAILSPGFSVDCLETLEEIAIQGKEIFLANGGKNFTMVPCLNSSPESMQLLKHLANKTISGWD